MPTLPPISPEVFKAYQDEISKNTSPATAKRKAVSLNKFFDWASTQGHIPVNPIPRPEGTSSFVITPKKGKVSTRAWAIVGITSSMVVLIFLLLYQLKLPIPFIKSFAQESKLQTLTNNNLQTVPPASTQLDPGTIPANSAVVGSWNLFAKLKLSEADGSPRVGSESLTFKLFDSESEGKELYSSSAQNITTDSEGSALISLADVPSNLFFENNTLFLEPQVGSGSATARIPVSTASTPAVDLGGNIVLTSESPSIKAKSGNLLIEGQTVTVKATDGSGGGLEFNPDANGIAHFLFEGNKGNFLNAQGPNLTSGSLYYGMVPNNATGYDLIRLQSGAPKMTTKFAVDAVGNTKIARDLYTGGVDRLTNAGALQNITGYSQNSGNFVVKQNPGDFASINKTITSGGALSDVLTLTLDERGKPATTNSDYSTLVLNRYDGNGAGAALKVNTGNAIFNGQARLGRFDTNPSSIGTGSLIYNNSDNTLYFWNGSAWVSVGTAATVPFSGLLSGTNTVATMVVGTGASLDFTGSGTINASTLLGSTWATPGEIGSGTPNSGSFTTLNASGTVNFSGLSASKVVFTDGSENLTSTGTVGTDQGGTGFSSYTVGDLLYADTTSTLAKLNDIAVGNALISGGVGTAPSWGKIVLGTHTTGNYVSSLAGTANQITADAGTGDVTLSIPSDFRAPGTINAVNGLYTGATAGTQRIDASGNLTNIGTTQFNTVTYTWPGSATAGYVLQSGSTGASSTLSWVDPATAVASSIYWTSADGALFPKNNSLDVLIGADSTASAKFAFTGVASGTPTASISGTYLTSTGNLANTNMEDITLGGATTGNVIASSPFSAGSITDTGLTASKGVFTDANKTLTSTGVLGTDQGGTGLNSYTTGDLIYASNTNTLSQLADVAVGNALISGGVGTAPSWGKIVLGTHTSGNYVSSLAGTANQITASAATGDITLSIPSDFRAPGTVNAVNGIYTGATAGTQRIDSSGNLTNIGTTQINGVTYTWPGSATAGYVLQSGSTGASSTLSWVDPAAAVASSIPWFQGDGVLYPKNNTTDVLIGADSTASAKFAFTGVYSGTPTASISGTTANVATYLTGEGNLATTNMKSLTLGGTTTGNILIPNGNLGINNATPGNKLSLNSPTTADTLADALIGTSATTQKGLVIQGLAGQSANLQEWQNSSGTVLSQISGAGDWGIGTTPLDYMGFRLIKSSTLTTGSVYGGNGVAQLSPTANFDTYAYGYAGSARLATAQVQTGGGRYMTGLYGSTAITNGIAGTIKTGYGGLFAVDAEDGIITTGHSMHIEMPIVDTGSMTTAVGSYIAEVASGIGTITNAYGQYIESVTKGSTLNYAIYTNAGLNRLGDQLSIVGSADRIQSIVKGNATQTTNLAEFQNSGGTPVVSISNTGDLTVTGNTTLGDAITDNITFTGRVAQDSDLIPITTTGTNDLGSTLLPWDNIYGVALFQNGNAVCDSTGANCPFSGGYWGQALGALYPLNNGVDLLIGSDSTASAKFAFMNVGSGTPTASIAGSIANVATYLTGDGTLSTTNAQALTLGSSTTGNVIINSRGSTALTADGANVTIAGDLAVNGGDLTTNQTTFNLINATATTLNLGGAATTFNIGPTGASGSIALSGGSADTGCTLDGTTGNFTCSGNITTTATTGTQGFWAQNLGALYPINSSVDLLIGSSATTSADFAFTGVNGGLPTASIAGNVANVATYLTGNGTLSTTNAQPLTLGSSTTGNVIINSRGSTALTADGANLTGTGTYTFPNTNTLTGVASYLQLSQGISVGGATTYHFDSSGNIVANDIAANGGNLTTTSTGTATVFNTNATTLNIGGDATVVSLGDATGTTTINNALAVTLATNLNGDATIGNAITDNITFTGRVAQDSDLIPITTTGTNTLGTALLPWDEIYGGAIYQGAFQVCDSSGANCPAGAGFWAQALGALYPTNNTVDLLIGAAGGATQSAKFAFTNVLTGIPTASIAGNIADVATYLTGNGILSTTNAQDLILGSATTGNVVINSRGLTALTADGANLTAAGNVTIAGTTGLVFSGVGGDITFTNGEKIDNDVNGVLQITSPTTSLSGVLTVDGTSGTGISITNTGITTDVSLQNGETIDNNVDGAVNIGATTLELTGVTTIHSDQTSIALLNTSTTTLNFGGAATTFNIGPAGASGSIAFSGGSADTGCTLDGTTGNLVCSGNITATGDLVSTAGNLTTSSTGTATVFNTNATTLNIGGDATVVSIGDATGTTTINNALAVTLATNLNGDTTIGNAITDNITFTGRVAQDSDLIPITTTGTNDLGSALLPWDNIYGVALFQNGNAVCDSSGAGCPFAGGYWGQALGALYPINNTVDVLIGSSATASADFAFTGVNGGLPTASIAGNIADVATYLTGNGTLSTTNAQPLTLGSSTTGNVIINSRGSDALTADGANVTIAEDLAVNGGDLTTNQATFNLINATATTLNIGGAATTLELGAVTGTTSINNALTVDGDTTLGNAITDNITFTGRVAQDSDLIPITATGTNDLGTALLPWDNIYGGTFTGNGSGLTNVDAATLDTLDSLQFLRSDTSDNFTSGTLTTDAGTTLDINGDLIVSDSSIAFDAVNTTFAVTGALTVTTGTAGNAAIVLPNDSIGPNEVFTTGQTDEYCLTYETTGGTWEWQNCGSAASVAWSSLTAPTADLTLAMAAYNSTFNWIPVADTAETNFSLTTQGTDTVAGGEVDQVLLALSQTSNGADVDQAADSLLTFANADADDPVGSAIRFDAGAAGTDFTYGINFDAASFGTAEFLLSNAATISNVTDGTLALTEPVIQLIGSTSVDFDTPLLDMGTQTVDVTLNDAVDALNFDSNTLSIDALNERVGIGTAAPLAGRMLDVAGSIGLSGGVGTGLFGEQTNHTYLQVAQNDYDFEFYTRTDTAASSERLRIEGGAVIDDILVLNSNFNVNSGQLYVQQSTGNVGVGTTGPDRRLESLDASSPQLRLTQADNTVYADFQVDSNGDLIVGVDGTTNQLVLDNGGNIGIGTAAPGTKLAVRGTTTEATYGSNLVTNGDFATGDFTSWTAGANWSVVSNAALHTTGSTATLAQDISVTNATTYQIEWTDTGTAGTYTFAIGAVVSRAYNYWETASSKRTTIVASGTGSQAFTITPSSGYNGSLDDITVRAITAYPSAVARIENSDGTTGLDIRAGGTGLSNTALGLSAFTKNTTGYYNSALGMQALYANTTGYYNSALGLNSLYSNTTGYYNSALGGGSLQSNTTGYYNSALGAGSLYSNTTGYFNSALGTNAGRYIADGSTANQTSNNSLYLGHLTKALASGDTNEIVIGSSATGLGNNSVVLGNDSIVTTALKGSVGIGDTSPDAKLEVLSTTEQLRLTHTDGTVDSRFTVDASGNLTINNTGTDTIFSDDITVSGGNINTGNIALTVGDATTDSVTLTTDGTGNGEVVLPNDSIGPNEIFTTGQTDEYCLTYEGTGTTWEWQPCSASAKWNALTDPDGDLTLAMGVYNTTFNWVPTADTAETNFSMTIQGQDAVAGGEVDQVLLALSQTSNGADVDQAADSLLTLANSDANDPVTSAIRFDAGAAGTDFTYGINFDAASFGTAELILSNAATIQNIADGTLALTEPTIQLVGSTSVDFDTPLLDLSTQTVDVTLNDAVDALNFDTNTLSIDALNERVGIGDAAPSAPLDVVGDVYISDGLSLFETAVSDGTVEATQFCTGDGETNCVTDFSSLVAGSGYWGQALGALYPNNNTVNVLIGSSATASADFAFTGVNGGLPTASIAGNIADVATYLTGNGALSTTNMQNLTLGSATTGNVIISSRGTTALTADAANLTAAGDLAVNGGDLTTTSATANLFTTSTTLGIGALTGTVTLRNALTVVNGNLRIDGTTGATLAGAGADILFSGTGSHSISNSSAGTDLTIDAGTTGLIQIGNTSTGNVELAGGATTGCIITNSTGTLTCIGDLATTAGNLITSSVGTAAVFNTTATTLNIGGDATVVSIGDATGTTTINNALAVTLATNLNGDTTIGNAITDNITFTGRVAIDSDLIPIQDAASTNDLGTSLLPWDNIYGVALFQNGNAVCDSTGANCPTSAQYWDQIASGVLYPVNSSVDVLIGGTATTSAKFAFINVLTGIPTASIAGNIADVATFLTGNGTLGTTNNQPLNIGNATTGPVIIGSNDQTVNINSSDWDISTVGDMSGIGSIGSDGDWTMTQATPSIFLTDTGGDDYSINVDGNAFDVTNATDSRQELQFVGDGSINFGDNTATKTIDIGGVSNDAADTVNIATEATSADVITIGNAHASTTLALTGGTSWSIGTNGNIANSGDLTITPSGGQLILADTATLNVGGKTNVGYNTFANAADAPAATTAITADNDLFIGGDLELKGGLYLTGKNIYNLVGTTPTATISLATDPSLADTFNTLGNGSWLVQNDSNAGLPALIVNQTYATEDIFVASSAGSLAAKFRITNAGDVFFGDNTGTDLTVGGGTGKIDVGTVDPPYTINGKKFATFLAGMVGVKEETAGLTNTNEYVPGVGYRSVIDFNNLPEGSDLWLFGKSTNIKENMNKLVALLTPSSPTKVWYDIDRHNNRIVIYSARPTEISYRLTGPRFDYLDHPNQRASDHPTVGFIINNLDTINTSAIEANVQQLASFVAEKVQGGAYTLKDSTGTIIDGFESIGNFVAGNIKAGAIQTKEIASQSFTSFQGTVDNLLVSSGLVTPRAQIALISPIPGESSIAIRLGNESTASGKLAVQDGSGAEVASIDSAGNASFSGELYAKNIHATNLDEIQAMLTQVKTDQDLLTQIQNSSTLNATGSANISELITRDLFVTGHAAISSLLVNDNFSVDNINSLSGPLKIQSLAMAPVELMAGLVTIDTQGNVNISGDLYVAGKITTPQLDAGIINATGSATFNSVATTGLIIGASDATVSGVIANGEINTNSTIGKAIIPAETSEIIIRNPKVTDYALVYVTPTSETQNYVLYIKEKSNGYFKVGFDRPLSIDVSFNWWVVEVAQ